MGQPKRKQSKQRTRIRRAANHYELPQFAKEVMLSLLPIAAMFAAFQLLTHRYSRRQRLRVLIGFGYTCLGLVLFLCGVNVGFGPVGTLLGTAGASGMLDISVR